ncbi:hypothetical protein [Ectopseudomonas alcaliphila]|uniref:Uncharacterized protein n=1 Tax=Ectopseudomonas alcaliphila TaxID=101564 RepID=A0A1G7PF61_9GAMM|nr:hypothetical protein [Pseudomonas alcaliphila]MDX5994478.1 hypothetical protein [Pseudomonas alcaliphila]SDF84289.1 hypothetical protein SAMN05216575_11228 [Pseudomonas alcaliphila]
MPGNSLSALYSRLLLTALLLPLAPCGFAQDMIERFGERPYTGRVDFKVAPPSGKPVTHYGRGSVLLERSAPGKAVLQLRGKVPDSTTQTELTIPGTYDDAGWRSEPDDVQMSIAADGRVSGGGVSDGRTFLFSGTFSPAEVRLEVRVTMAREEGGAPAGTTLTFDYRVKRESLEAQAGQDVEDGCRLVMRPIANFGGGMTMAQVPECD